jgi:hypothetical protein
MPRRLPLFAAGLPGVEEGEDVRVLEGGSGLDLREEALGAHHGRQLGLQDLDRHLAIVAYIVGQIDGGHPALAQLALDAVAVGQGGREAGGNVGHGRGWFGVGGKSFGPVGSASQVVPVGSSPPASLQRRRFAETSRATQVSIWARYWAFLPRQLPASMSDKNGRSCALPVS